MRKVATFVVTAFVISAIMFIGVESNSDNTIESVSLVDRSDPFTSDSALQSDEFQSTKAHRLSRFWERSEIQPQFLQAECGTCHRTLQVAGAPLLNYGRKLIRERGCVGCHDLGDVFELVERGPNLDEIGIKTERGWLYNWIKDPSIYLPDPGMPEFRLSEVQVLYVIEYLMSLDSKDSPPLPVFGNPLEGGDPDHGGLLVGDSRCINCHSIHGSGGSSASELEIVGSKLRPKWLANYLRNVHYYEPEKQVHAFNFSEQDALDVSAYIFKENSGKEFAFPEASSVAELIPESVTQDERVATGRSLFLAYGCSGCHTVAGIPRLKIARSLSEVTTQHEERLSSGVVEVATKNLASWIYMKISDPDKFSQMRNMPDFSVSKEEALAMTVAVLANKPVDYPEEWIVRATEQEEHATTGGVTQEE